MTNTTVDDGVRLCSRCGQHRMCFTSATLYTAATHTPYTAWYCDECDEAIREEEEIAREDAAAQMRAKLPELRELLTPALVELIEKLI